MPTQPHPSIMGYFSSDTGQHEKSKNLAVHRVPKGARGGIHSESWRLSLDIGVLGSSSAEGLDTHPGTFSSTVTLSKEGYVVGSSYTTSCQPFLICDGRKAKVMVRVTHVSGVEILGQEIWRPAKGPAIPSTAVGNHSVPPLPSRVRNPQEAFKEVGSGVLCSDNKAQVGRTSGAHLVHPSLLTRPG